MTIVNAILRGLITDQIDQWILDEKEEEFEKDFIPWG
jgi:hypothetical protein